MSDSVREKKQPPWLAGIIDTLVGAELIGRSTIPHKNRLIVILIDSAFETACRAYLRYRARIQLTESHKRRENLISTIKSKLKDIDQEVWDSIDFYYTEIRCDFYHESAGKTITDVALLDYRDTVDFVIEKCLGVSIRTSVSASLESISSSTGDEELANDAAAQKKVSLTSVKNRVEKVLIAVAATTPTAVEELNEFFKREGDSVRLKPDEFTSILARNSGSKKFFFFDKQLGRWQLSGLGKFKLNQICEEVTNG
jgi:hypothetical protein